MPSPMRNGERPGQHTARAVRDRQLQAIAQDHRSRGGNPVTVADIRQDHGTRVSRGAAILSSLLRR